MSRADLLCALSGIVCVAAFVAGDVTAADSPSRQVSPLEQKTSSGDLAAASQQGLSSHPRTGTLDGEQLQATKDRLRAFWEEYDSQVTTARIEFVFLMFSLKSRSLTAEQFTKELFDLNLVADENLSRRLVEQFCPEKLQGPPEKARENLAAVHEVRTFTLRGGDRRCSSAHQEHILGPDLHLLIEPKNRAVKAYRRGACPYWTPSLTWFRAIPPVAILDANSSIIHDGDCFHLVEDGLQGLDRTGLTVDAADGLPRRWELVSAGSGRLVKLELYRDYAVYPGEVLLPAVRVEVNLQEEIVRTVLMTVVREARFNLNLDDSEFRLAVPAGWKWFDSRQEKLEGGTWKKPVADAAAFFTARSAGPPVVASQEASASATVSWRSVLLILNGSLLVIVGIALWKRSA
jgi:hypothetical protein